MGFAKPNAEAKPTIVGVGSLASFGSLNKPKFNEETGKQSTYFNEEVKIKGRDGAPDNKFRLLWRPDWFQTSFNPQSLDKGSLFVYKRNVSNEDAPSFLDGLTGSIDGMDVLCDALQIVDVADPDAIHATLAGFFRQLGPVPFLYVQQQERKVVGEDDEGKKIRKATSYYEVDAIMPLTLPNAKRLIAKANYAAKRRAKAIEDGVEPPNEWRFKTDFADYGIEVKLPESVAPAWV